MLMRTDLAIEEHEINKNWIQGIQKKEKICEELKITEIQIKTPKAAKNLNKSIGHYITIESMPLTDNFRDVKRQILIISKEIRKLLPKEGSIIAVGIGNSNITPDAVGPKSAAQILATRHIKGELARSTGLDKLRPIAVISPGVLGQTGIEVSELISGLIKKISPAAVIAIDALASRSLARLGRTIQISDTGIVPGSGIGNHRMKLTKETLGIPVIAIGIPTVVDAVTLAYDLLEPTSEKKEILQQEVSPGGEQMMVTPREIDLLTERAAKIVSMAINCAVQKDFDFDDLAMLLS